MQTSIPSVPELARTFREQLDAFLAPLLIRLDQQLDRRLVKTFAATLLVVLQNRYRAGGLLLSELGAFLTSPEHAPAGTKRLSNLLRSPRWDASLLSDYLWEHATRQFHGLVARNREPLVLWDESVLEKPESIALEGLGSVRSTRAQRLKRIRKGYYNPPGGAPVVVPGLHWLGLLLIGSSGPPTLAAMRWWTNRGPNAEEKREVEAAFLLRCVTSWGKAVLHVFDRGFAGAPWLTALAEADVRFVMRWQKGYHLYSDLGEEAPAWMFTRGKRSQGRYELFDPRTRKRVWRGVASVRVWHPAYPRPLWLIVSRPGKGHEPWYLLTNELADTPDTMWRIVRAYARRWQIEMAFRFCKTELLMQSPRLWSWENRLKLLLIVSLAYAFLLTLLDPYLTPFRDALLRRLCHRTGKRSRLTPTPLYRIRIAITHLCHSTGPPLSFFQWQSSG